MSLKDTLRDKLVELRVDERDLAEQLSAITARIESNRAEQERIKAQLIRDAETTLRLKVSSHESARATVARLGSFTLSELKAELGWETPRVRKFMATMECEKPAVLKPNGRFGTKPMWRWVGPAYEDFAEQEREAADIEVVSEWAMSQTTRFTPAECAAGCDQMSRATALRILRAMQETGVITDVGPTVDMPIFEVTGVEAPDMAVDRPDLHVVDHREPLSKIPQIRELIDAAHAAHCEVIASNGHFRVEALDGRSAVIKSTPQGRSQLMQDKAKLRRIGVQV